VVVPKTETPPIVMPISQPAETIVVPVEDPLSSHALDVSSTSLTESPKEEREEYNTTVAAAPMVDITEKDARVSDTTIPDWHKPAANISSLVVSPIEEPVVTSEEEPLKMSEETPLNSPITEEVSLPSPPVATPETHSEELIPDWLRAPTETSETNS
jgi:hypothetical protein